MTAGEKLRELRGNRSVKEVADSIGIPRSTLAMYELDLRRPRDETKIRIAKFYKKSVRQLFYSEEMLRNETKNI